MAKKDIFKFRHMKSPAWASDSMNSVYFKVIWEAEGNEYDIGYIGFQENDFGRGLCRNMCYKTYEPFRGKGLTKEYVKYFVENRILDLDCIRAKTPKDNIASQRVLEYAGFENRGSRDEGEKIGYTWKAF